MGARTGGRREREPDGPRLALRCRGVGRCRALAGARRASSRSTAAHRRYTRGALVRRMLLLADVVGLIASFAIASVLVAPQSGAADKVGPRFEFVVFLLAIPFWILLLRLEGLYDRDEERADHSTVDDIVGVFRAVTIGVWVFAVFGVVTNLVQPVLGRLGVFWVVADHPRADPPRGLPPRLSTSTRLQPERGYRRCRQGRAAARSQGAQPSGVRHQSRRLRR